MAKLDDLMAALTASAAAQATTATSVRLPEAVKRATDLAVEMGMDESATAAMTNALIDRVATFARQRAFAEHFEAFPSDIPDLADVAARRLAGSGHVGERRPDLITRAAAHIQRRRPRWAESGAVDDAVEAVIALAEAIDELTDSSPEAAIKPKSRVARRAAG